MLLAWSIALVGFLAGVLAKTLVAHVPYDIVEDDIKHQPTDGFPAYMQFQFDADGRTFLFWLQRKHGLVGSGSRVVVHVKEEDAAASSVNGRPYICNRLVIYRINEGGVKAIEHDQANPNARFYAYRAANDEDGHLLIQGGFWWEGQFFKVKRPIDTHKMFDDGHNGRMLAMRTNEKPHIQVVSVDDAEGGTPCGHDRLSHNREVATSGLIRGALSPSHNQDLDEQLTMALQMKKSNLLFNTFDGDLTSAAGGCPTQRKALYVAAVADCGYMREFGGSREEATAAIISDFNLASEVFERQFNIELGLTDIHLMDACRSPDDPDGRTRWNDKCTNVPSMEERLSLFSAWQPTLKLHDKVGVVHLMTGCVESAVVGIAWLNQVCQREPVKKPHGKEVVAGTSMSAMVANQHAIIMHEIGHNLGAIHDCESDGCAKCDVKNLEKCSCCACGLDCDCRGKYVMSPESGGRNVSTFSSCSYGDICRKMPVLAQRCLHDPGSLRTLNEGGVCGDGIKDPGEECDCGSNCDKDACCTPECKLKPHAKCSDSNDQCCSKCQLRPKGETCRLALDTCQEEARCDGSSPDCPKAHFKNDTETCELSDADFPAPFMRNLHCASGVCTNRDLQCLALGRRLGITGACSFMPNSCRLLCQAGPGRCIGVDAHFLDGTKCGVQGICQHGKCTESELLGFLRRNKYLLIGLGVIGLVILLAVIIRKHKSSSSARANSAAITSAQALCPQATQPQQYPGIQATATLQ